MEMGRGACYTHLSCKNKENETPEKPQQTSSMSTDLHHMDTRVGAYRGCRTALYASVPLYCLVAPSKPRILN